MNMTWERFFDDVKAGAIAPVYLFSGPENYIKRAAEKALMDALLPAGLEEMNLTPLEGANARQISDACQTLPFMAPKRLVTVRDWAPLMPGKARDEQAEGEQLALLLASPPESCCLLFIMREQPDGRKSATAALQKAACCISFDYLPDDRLIKKMSDMAREAQAKLNADAARSLLDAAGKSLTRLEGEIAKLAAYAGAGGEITCAAVEMLVAPSAENTVFQMIDALMNRDQAKALSLQKALLLAGENRIGIMAMLTRQMRMLTHIKLAAEGGDLPETIRQLGLGPYPAKRMQAQAKRLSAPALEKVYRACVETDYAVKRGLLRDEAALDWLMIQLGK